MQSNKQIVTCLLGNPVEHSVSDSMFAYFSKISGLKNYKHLKLKIPKTKLKIATISLIVFDFFGANITLPFKESIIKFLDNLDVNSKNIGAVNTIVNKNGKLFGYNTDYMGAMKSIENKLGKIQKTDKVLIFGAGGASRAIIYGLLKKTNLITILIKKSDLNKIKRIQKSFNKNIKYGYLFIHSFWDYNGSYFSI